MIKGEHHAPISENAAARAASAFGTLSITPKCRYEFKDYHHNGNNRNSQWTINAFDEANLYYEAYSNQIFIVNQKGDRIDAIVDQDSGKLLQLGYPAVTSSKEYSLYLARFHVNSQSSHGYPVDYMKDNEDRPSEKIINFLIEHQKMCKKYRKRLLQGKKLK